jgi:hypothetical protein
VSISGSQARKPKAVGRCTSARATAAEHRALRRIAQKKGSSAARRSAIAARQNRFGFARLTLGRLL